MHRTFPQLKVLLITGILAASMAGCGARSLGAVPTAPSASATPNTQRMNTQLSDGGVTMSIDDVNCDHPAAAGEACRVTFHAVNISDGFPLFNEADQVAYDANGHAFHPDEDADTAANRGKTITQRLPRGVPVTGVLVFAMPVGDRIDYLVMHGQAGTPGETFPVS